MRRRVLGCAIAVATGMQVTACGSGAPTTTGSVATNTPGAATVTASATPRATPSATPAPQMLFAVLEAHGDNAKGALRDDTVAIVGLDGYARAKARFTPQPVPDLGSFSADGTSSTSNLTKRLPVLLTEAHVAGGAVYYADGKGVVRRLGLEANPTTITTFPLTSAQQAMSFAVSPDGARLVGQVFTAPARSGPDSCGGNDCFGASPVFTNVLYQAQVGGAPAQVRTTRSSNFYDTHIGVAGWDSQGPLAITDVPLSSNGGYAGGGDLGQALSTIARLGSDGAAGLLLGGSRCIAVDESDSGAVACSSTGVEVHSATGVSLYSVGLADLSAVYVSVSPDGNQVAASFEPSRGSSTPAAGADRCIVQAKDGSTIQLPGDFKPEGWLDPNTLVGIHGADSAINGRQGPLGVVRLSSPTSIVDVGFSGSYVGLIQAGI